MKPKTHVAIFGLFFVALQYMQQILGYSPLLSGLAVLPMAAAFALSSAAAHLSERVGAGPVIASGLVLAAAGLGVLAILGVGSSYWHVLGGFILAGAGMALSAAPATNAIVASLPQGKQGVASAVNDLSRELGGVLGIAILGSVLNAGYRSGLADAVRGMPGEVVAQAQESLAPALRVARQLGGAEGERLALGRRHRPRPQRRWRHLSRLRAVKGMIELQTSRHGSSGVAGGFVNGWVALRRWCYLVL